MSQAIAVNPVPAPATKPHRQKKLEGRLLMLRMVIDTLLFCGGLFVAYGMTKIVHHIFPLDVGSLCFLWSVVALISSVAIVIVTCKHVSQATRKLTSALLAVLLLSFASVNALVFWFAPEMLTQIVPTQLLFLGIAAWALVCLGLICVETRLENSLPAPSSLKTNFSLTLVCWRFMMFSVLGVAWLVLLLYPFITGAVFVEQCASSWWPVTEATLVAPLGDDDEWLNYTYNVDGQDYIGTREVAFFKAGSSYSTHGNPERRLAELKSQDTFPVSYNPSHPERSLVEPGISNLMLLCIWASGWYMLMIPIYARSLRDVYQGNSLRKAKATLFESVTAAMAFTGIGLGFAWWGLVAWVPWQVDWASILMVIGVWIVYHGGKTTALKRAQEKMEASAEQGDPLLAG